VQLSVGRGGAFNLCRWQFDLLMQPGLPETIWARALAPAFLFMLHLGVHTITKYYKHVRKNMCQHAALTSALNVILGLSIHHEPSIAQRGSREIVLRLAPTGPENSKNDLVENYTFPLYRFVPTKYLHGHNM